MPLNRPCQTTSELSRLLASIANGDVAALQFLYGIFAPSIYGPTLRITRDIALADAIVRDTFVNIWQKAAGYDTKELTPLGWLTRMHHEQIVQHLSGDPLKSLSGKSRNQAGKLKRHASPPLDASVSSPPTYFQNPDPKNWIVLLLAHAGRLSWKEIEDVLRMPRSSAKACIRSALSALKADADLGPDISPTTPDRSAHPPAVR